MDTAYKIAKFQIQNVFRSLWLIIYAIGLFLITTLIIFFTSDSSKVAVSLLSIVLILNPLISILFGGIYVYNSQEFIRLVLTQPIERSSLFFGLFLGLLVPFVLVSLIGMGVPLFLSGIVDIPLSLDILAMGILVQSIFVSLGIFVTVSFPDKPLGLGIAFLVWLGLCWIYDGLILFISFAFQDYPLEKFLLFLIILNPIDLARITILTKLDTAAMLGVTGAIFKAFLEGSIGNFIAFLMISFWIFLPLFFSYRKFIKKDF